MPTNMEIWDAVRQPPKSALKTIMGGRLKGKTDINPQWRYQVMTEQFGMCGVGWKYEVKRVWTEPAPDGQVFAFAEVALYVREITASGWSDSIPGIGGSMLVEKETNGLHANDEGYKMAITDALSVAMKMLGVGADIYAGLWDGTKYTNDVAGGGEPPSTKTGEPPKEHWCAEDNVPFTEKTDKDGKHWWSHRKADGTWCNEKKDKAQVDTTPVTRLQSVAIKEQIGGKEDGAKLDTEFDDILQQLHDVKWDKTATLNSWLASSLRIPMAALAGKTLREVIEYLNHDHRLALCNKLNELAALR